MSAVLAAAIAWEAWESKEPLQHQHWLGNLLVAALLRERGKVASHLFALNTGLRLSAREKPGSQHASACVPRRDRRRRVAWVERNGPAGDGKRPDGTPAQKQTQKLDPAGAGAAGGVGRLIARELKVSQRAALNLIAELGIREMTGRGRYRVWGIL
jgi:hypothetical protein